MRPTEGSIVARRSLPQAACEALAWCLLVLALARPQFVEPPVENLEPQRDILIALDLSQSMDTKDFPSTSGIPQARVEAVKDVVSDFVSRRPSDRLGLVAFGDAPYPLAPFTMDHDLVQTMIKDALPGMAGPRTALGDALGLAIKMFDKTDVPDKVLIVLTDGNDTASRMPPLKAAEIARSKSVVVHTVGIGDPAATGEDKLDTETLEKIAEGTGGRYFFGGDQNQLAAIYLELDRITPQNQKVLLWRPKIELYQWPLTAAVVLLSAFHSVTAVIGLFRRRISP